MRLTLVLCAILALTACLGGGGAGESDYESDVFTFLAEDDPEPAEGDLDAIAAQSDRAADQLDSFNPPPSIEDEHEDVVNAFRGAADILREISESRRTQPSSDQARRLLEHYDTTGVWLDAFAAEYGVRHFGVEGAAMLPTFTNGDHFKVPVYSGEPILRGQVIIFLFHLQPADGSDRHFIKRVIGLPGETIEVRDGAVFVDGVALVEDYLLNTPTYTYGPRTVPSESYFVLGDNRRNSYDSHQWPTECASGTNCEFVPEENIVGVLPADAKPYARTEEDSSD